MFVQKISTTYSFAHLFRFYIPDIYIESDIFEVYLFTYRTNYDLSS